MKQTKQNQTKQVKRNCITLIGYYGTTFFYMRNMLPRKKNKKQKNKNKYV